MKRANVGLCYYSHIDVSIRKTTSKDLTHLVVIDSGAEIPASLETLSTMI
jgi:hypothetical protein